MDKSNTKLVIALLRASKRLTEVESSHFRQFGLNNSEFGVLDLLYHKGAQPVQIIAEKILVSSGTMTYILNKLETRDLIRRDKCVEDGRVYYAVLTEHGNEFFADIWPVHLEFLASLFSELSEDQKTALTDQLFNLYNQIS